MEFTQPLRPDRVKNKVGQKHGLLTVVEFVGMNGKMAWYRCSCECGTENVVLAGCNISSKNTKSCGCLKHKPAVSRISTDDFVARAKTLHGERLDYSLVQYVGAKIPVVISCPVHGQFSQTPQDHLRSPSGCPQCSALSRTEKQTSSTEEFVERSLVIHGGKYSYENVDYKTARIKVGITCKLHGVFHQYPHQHLVGVGCPICASKANGDMKRGSVEKFILSAREVHGDKYDYSRVVYITARTRVELFCNTHQKVFWQTPDNHTRRMGCPSCAQGGFSQVLPGTLYILQSPDFVKVGITNISAEERARSVSKSAMQKFDVIKTYEMDGVSCNNLENTLLRWLRGFAKSPTYKFEGSTEAFCVNVTDVLNKVEELING